MRRPADRPGKANSVARLMIGRGVDGVRRDHARGGYIEIPGYQIRVGAHFFHDRKSDAMVLREMRRENTRAPMTIRLTDPEIEEGMVAMTVDTLIDLLVKAQR